MSQKTDVLNYFSRFLKNLKEKEFSPLNHKHTKSDITDFTDDTKVTNTLNKTVKAYLTGTTSSETNTGTQIFDTGIYIDETEGRLRSDSLSTDSISFGSLGKNAEIKYDSSDNMIIISIPS